MVTGADEYDLPQVYSPEEITLLEKGRSLVASFEGAKHETLKTGTKLVKGDEGKVVRLLAF
jgi:hypothetical protein